MWEHTTSNKLYHHGVKGMKWGVRRNRDRYITGYQAKVNATKAAEEARKKSVAESRASGDKGVGSFQRANRKALNAKRKAYGESIKKDLEYNKQLRANKRQEKDMRGLEKTVKKAAGAMDQYLEFRRSHSYRRLNDAGQVVETGIYIDDPKLRKSAEKYSKRVDTMVSTLSKKYDRVSAIPERDAETGKMYVDIIVGNKTSRVYSDQWS